MADSYVIVPRSAPHLAVERLPSLRAAADRIIDAAAHDRWSVMTQADPPAGPLRALTTAEAVELERWLYPVLGELTL